jgi:hypothetical protein
VRLDDEIALAVFDDGLDVELFVARSSDER